MILILSLFGLLCLGVMGVGMSQMVLRLGIRLNLTLMAMSVVLFVWWRYVESQSPPTSIAGHWGMVVLSLIGFLAMLLSTISAFRALRGVRAGIIVIASIVVGLVHLLDIIVALPVS